MKVAVIGNCQARVICEALPLMVDGLDVEVIYVSRISDYDAAAEQASRCDLVFCHPLTEAFGALEPKRFGRMIGNRLHLVPTIAFTGFQPDSIYVFAEGKPVLSPMGSFHSALVIKAFLDGVPVTQAMSYFDPFIYSKAGYFSAYDHALDRIEVYGRQFGYELRSHAVEWTKAGCFTHTFNHPHKRVLVSLCELMCERAGLSIAASAALDEIADHMQEGGRWPVYEEIANLCEIRGGGPMLTHFTRPFNLPREISMTEFVDQSMQQYRNVDRQILVNAIDAHPVSGLA